MPNRRPAPIKPTNETERAVAAAERKVEQARRALAAAIAARDQTIVYAYQHDGARMARIAAVANYARRQIGAPPLTEQAIATVVAKASDG